MIEADSVSEAVAAGRVPDDVDISYLEESRDQEAIVGIIFITVLTTIVLGGRVFSRAVVLKRFGPDDGLAVLSWATLVAFVALCIILIRIGSGRHFEYILYVMSEQRVLDSQVLDFAAHLIYTTALLICRMSGLTFYYRLCSLHDGFLLAIKIVAGVLVAGYLPQMFLIVFHCLPLTGLWPYDFQPQFEDYTCLQWGLIYSVNSAVSLFCDFLLFGLPIAMLRILSLSRRRKIQLACILLPGVGVVAISIARLVLVIRGQWEADMSWYYNPMLAVEVSEIGATLIALSVPGMKPLVEKLFERGNGKPLHTDDSGAYGPSHNLSLRPSKSMLGTTSTRTDFKPREELEESKIDDKSAVSSDGIMVKVDFRINEEHGKPQFDSRNQYKKLEA